MVLLLEFFIGTFPLLILLGVYVIVNFSDWFTRKKKVIAKTPDPSMILAEMIKQRIYQLDFGKVTSCAKDRDYFTIPRINWFDKAKNITILYFVDGNYTIEEIKVNGKSCSFTCNEEKVIKEALRQANKWHQEKVDAEREKNRQLAACNHIEYIMGIKQKQIESTCYLTNDSTCTETVAIYNYDNLLSLNKVL